MTNDPRTESRTSDPRFRERVEVLIVGSGPTGAAYARTITEQAPGTRVLVLEAGPIATDPPGNHVANIADPVERSKAQVACQGPNDFEYPRFTHVEAWRDQEGPGFQSMYYRPGIFALGTGGDDRGPFPVAQATSCVGGMAAHWFGACPRPSGTERIDFLDQELLDATYLRAEKILKVSNTQVLDHKVAEEIRAGLGSVVDEGRPPAKRTQQMPMALVQTTDGVVRSGTNVVFGALLDGTTEGFELRPLTLVQRVLMDGDTAIGVEARDRTTDEVYTIGASFVVVACDGIRTPQLLFASGIRPPALGRYFNEHPQVSVAAAMRSHTHADATTERGDTTAMSDASATSIASSGVTWIPFNDEDFPYHGQIHQIDRASLGLTEEQLEQTGTVLTMSLFLRQDLDPENRVEFSEDEQDWLGMPAIRFHYRLSEADERRIERAKKQLVELANAVGGPLLGEEPRALPSGSSIHHLGTVRMGTTDDGTSVCNTSSRVWETTNVYVAGNGVIPTATACNPTLTSVTIAILGAEEIVRRLAEAA